MTLDTEARPATGVAGRLEAAFDTGVRHAHLARWAREFEWLWIAGLVLALTLGMAALFPINHGRHLWGLYLLLGAGLPGLLLVHRALELRRPGLAPLARRVRLALATLLTAAVVTHALLHFDALAVLAALVQVPVILLLRGRRSGWPRRGEAPRLLAWTITGLGAWGAAASMVWWAPAGPWLASSAYSMVVFGLASGVVLWSLWRSRPVPTSKASVMTHLATVVASVSLALVSLHNSPLFDLVSFHHWGFYVGPAELVRQGGWLLWDVPSQYGFLSVLAIAAFPSSSPWEALYLLNALLNLLSALIVFLALRTLGRGPVTFVFSLAAAMAAEFFRSHAGTAGPGLVGPEVFPSIGAYRFFWCLLLLGIVLLTFRSAEHRRRWLVLGNVAWLAGVLWSAESAVYCSVTWLPAYALLAQARHRSRWLALPALMLGTALIGIGVWYLRGIGHLPDPRAYADYALAYSGGFGAVPIAAGGGAGWALLLLLTVLGGTALQLVRGVPLQGRLPSLAVVVAAAAAVWISASYFVSRSVPSNVWHVAPIMFVAIAMMFQVAHLQRQAPGAALARLAVAPIFIVTIAFTFGDLAGITTFATAPPRDPSRVETGVPPIDPSLAELMKRARIGATDPVVYSGPEASSILVPGSLDATHPMWLPAAPVGELAVVPGGRRNVYVARFLARCPGGGWLLEARTPADPSGWLYDELGSFEVTAYAANDAWRVVHYEPRDHAPARSCR